MFANCSVGGNNMAMPDVCITPIGPAMVPIPYPNISMCMMAIPPTTAMKVLISGGPAHNLGTKIAMSNGDQPGVGGGVVSHMIMGPTKYLMGATATMIGGKPAARLSSMTGHNGSSMNTVGATIAPSQVKVMVMK
ncbi:DUF4150 domain-containing protein [Bacterioplanoides pacificum]|uniref:DUF4150 domain-containing protein n=1 Tax=Bacterioplanoides pacificum TaxID=1171596 RepID=A0ABV7VSH6_9GAMM